MLLVNIQANIIKHRHSKTKPVHSFCLIDVTCFLAENNFFLCVHDVYTVSPNQANYVDLLNS